ncbi:exo-alpha-sialidase [bacterium]|nr:exo-alpha-sialidase [bacterium]
MLAAVYGWFKGDNTPCPYQPRMCKFRCFILRSRDRARHWEYVSTIATDPRVGEEGFDEPVMIRLTRGAHRGRLVCLMRTGSHQCPIYQSVSDDDGATWSKPRALWFRGVDPDLVELTDGTLACSFGWRTRRWTDRRPPARLGNYLVFSRDQGATWTHLTRLPIEPHANTPWTTGYTSVCATGPRRLLVAYDIGRWGQPVRYIATREVRV